MTNLQRTSLKNRSPRKIIVAGNNRRSQALLHQWRSASNNIREGSRYPHPNIINIALY